METALYLPVKRFLEKLGFTVKGEIGGCDLVALSSFYKYCCDQQVISHNPVAGVRRPRLTQEPKSTGLETEQLRRFLAAAEQQHPMIHAVMCLLAYNGLRASEPGSIDLDDLAVVRGHRTVAVLRKARDTEKDQSYFLHAVERRHFANVSFPLGEFTKAEVRALAREAGLPVYDKPDSTGICFIGERPFREFLSRYIPTSPGDIVDEHGEVVGRHRGLAFYTLGQRGGLEIGGRSGAREDAWYVAAKNLRENQLVVVQGHDHPLLASRALTTGPCNWLVQRDSIEFDSAIKVRYRQPDQPCHAVVGDDGAIRVTFAEPQRAVTPGQFAVLYDGDRCLGGGPPVTD